MKLLFDGRVFKHKNISGVEAFSYNLRKYLKVPYDIVIPKFYNKYFEHLWEHTVLPIKARKYDILLCPANIAPIFKFNNKLVIVLHDISYLKFSDSVSKSFYYYYKFIIPRNLKLADRVITISEHSKMEIIEVYPFTKNKIEVIYNGIDHQHFYYNKKIKKRDYILFVGSMNPRKNLIRLIEGYLKISSKTNIELIILGNYNDVFYLSTEELDIFEEAKKIQKITFLENILQKDLTLLYQEAKLFIFPSLYEGFGFPPLEAMACGTPVLSSPNASLKEVCKDAVLYIDPLSIDDIAEKILFLLNDKSLQQSLIKKGLERASEFTWEKTADKYIKILEKVALV